MGKWPIGWGVVLLSCLPIFLSRSSNSGLLEDSDTRVLLAAVRDRGDLWSWFGGDWPLGNHFYRPVSTLFFELDNALYGSNAAGYGLTNAILCIACVLALFWLLRELTDRIEIALPGAALFALWHVGGASTVASLADFATWLALATLLLPGRRLLTSILAALTLQLASDELEGITQIQTRMIDWLPGRTASVMTLFVLVALAAYARYERVSARREAPAEPGPLDPPATKGTGVRAAASRFAPLWAVFSVFALALALGSYEQAVMAPSLLLGVALVFRLRRYRVRWLWQAVFWSLLAGYLVFRSRLVPTDVSDYQAQQFRAGPGVLDSLMAYLLPAWNPFWVGLQTLEVGGAIWMTVGPYAALAKVASNVAALVALRCECVFALAGWALSFLAFLPMAWLKHFDHYHYLPMALRALFAVALSSAALKLTLTAASLPAIQAPLRRGPAPGSLLHP